MTDYAQKIRVNRIQEPTVRIRVKPRVPPLEIELRNTGTEIEWRVGTTGTWETLVSLAAITGPAGADGVVQAIVGGLGISVNNTDPANPIVTASVQSVAALTGAITAAALKTALSIAVADITDASANGRSLISAADYAAMKALLAVAVADITDMTANGRSLVSAANYAAMKTLLAIAQADVSGLTTASSPQFAGIELGNASDTTLSRASAGRVNVEGNPILLGSTEQQTLAGGANVTVKNLGNLSGASITPNPGDRPIQKITNNGAGSILPGSNEGHYTLEVLNTTGAGAITSTGWTLKGDSFDTTTTSKFLCSCLVTSDMKVMTIVKVV